MLTFGDRSKNGGDNSPLPYIAIIVGDGFPVPAIERYFVGLL